LFLKANLDKTGGKVDGYCVLPSNASFFNFEKVYNSNNSQDFEIGKIGICDNYGNVIAWLNDHRFTLDYNMEDFVEDYSGC